MGKRIGEVLLSGLILGLCLAIFSGCGRSSKYSHPHPDNSTWQQPEESQSASPGSRPS